MQIAVMVPESVEGIMKSSQSASWEVMVMGNEKNAWQLCFTRRVASARHVKRQAPLWLGN